jgi:hypothetical protein
MSSRAVVVGIVDQPSDGERLVAAGADRLDVSGLDERDITVVRGRVDVPVLVEPLGVEARETVAELAAAAALGAPVLRTHDVRAARRVADVMAAVVEARAEA